jgi:tetratricopeptide (TPR) repeat protein
MKTYRLLFLLAALLMWSPMYAQMTLPPGGGNQRAEVTQYMGLVKVTIVYNSPDVAGREIWGKLVPYGLANLNFGKSTEQNPSPWRAGANENTTIAFSHDVQVEGKAIKAGTYGLHMIPGEQDWVVVFTNNSNAWGSYSYVPADEALRVSVKAKPCDEFNEFLAFDFIDRLQNSSTARLKWEKLQVPFKITVPNGDDLYVQRLRDEMSGPKSFNWLNVVAAANFCATKKMNLDEAYGWVQSLIDRNVKYFPIYNAKAGVQTAMGKPADADATMKEAINLPDASAGQIVGYGRSLITAKREKEAMPVFELANKRFPGNSTAMMGMARGWSASGDAKKALKFAQEALKVETNANNKTAIEGMIKKLEKGEAIN